MHQFLMSMLRDENGATAVEYGLLMAIIAAVLLVGLGAVGDELVAMFTRLTTQLTGA